MGPRLIAVNDAEPWRFVPGQFLRDGVNIFCRNAFRKATDQLRVVFRNQLRPVAVRRSRSDLPPQHGDNGRCSMRGPRTLTFLAAFWQVGRVIVAFNIEIWIETSPERQGFAFSRGLGFFFTGRAKDVLLNFIKMLLGNGLGQRFKALPITGASTSKPCSSFCTSSTRKNDFRPSSPVITT